MKKDLFKDSLPTIILAAVVSFVAIALISSLLSIFLNVQALMIVGIVFTVLGVFASLWGSNLGIKNSDILSRVCIVCLFVSAANVILSLIEICFIF